MAVKYLICPFSCLTSLWMGMCTLDNYSNSDSMYNVLRSIWMHLHTSADCLDIQQMCWQVYECPDGEIAKESTVRSSERWWPHLSHCRANSCPGHHGHGHVYWWKHGSTRWWPSQYIPKKFCNSWTWGSQLATIWCMNIQNVTCQKIKDFLQDFMVSPKYTKQIWQFAQ